MKKFALLNENNVVINISVADENWDSTGWIEYTDKNCGIGYVYDSINKVFISPQPFPSWILNNDFIWQAPIVYPNDGNIYTWNEESLSWDEAPTL